MVPTLTIFANFRIDSEERFLRMKDSFFSIVGIESTQWVINTRGAYKDQTNAFLHENLGNKLTLFELDSTQGWFNDTKKMLPAIDTAFIFFWVEDHLNLVEPAEYSVLLTELGLTGTDYLQYSWWHSGMLQSTYEHIPKDTRTTISAFTLTKKAFIEIDSKQPTFIISMVGIFSNKLFKNIILTTSPFLRQHPKQTPFSFEKGSEHKRWLPLKMALPKRELFAPIDDDNGEIGYSLQARGVYPIREKRLVPAGAPLKKVNPFKKWLPRPLYQQLITVVIYINKIRRYVALIKNGQ